MKHGFFGIGNSNLGVMEYLRRKGELGEVTLRSDTALPQETAEDLHPARILTGERATEGIDEDVLFLSPSVRRDRREIAEAERRGVRLSSDLELFLERRRSIDYAITGSDGKSTTTYLIARILNRHGVAARPSGNFGLSLSSLIDSDEVTVAELSSFQLEYTKPRVGTAVITGITPNHLNWHDSLNEYVAAKRNVATHAERIVADADGELVARALEGLPLYAAVSTELQYEELRTHVMSEHCVTYRCGTVYLDGTPYMDISSAIRKEPYNIKNYMLAAGALADAVSPSDIRDTVRSFTGLPHRAELILESDGIRYYDSSVDSTPERTLATLRGMRGRTAVIIAGRGKRLSLFGLAEALPTLTVGAVLMGEMGRELSVLLSRSRTGYPYVFASTMEDAARAAADLLCGEGNVILSPAGTSFDVYKNFEERGRAFANAVLDSGKRE